MYEGGKVNIPNYFRKTLLYRQETKGKEVVERLLKSLSQDWYMHC